MSEPRSAAVPVDLPAPGCGEYEWKVLTLTRADSRADVHRLLAAHAEYGYWEVARVRLHMNGIRRVWLRRRIIRVVRTA